MSKGLSFDTRMMGGLGVKVVPFYTSRSGEERGILLTLDTGQGRRYDRAQVSQHANATKP